MMNVLKKIIFLVLIVSVTALGFGCCNGKCVGEHPTGEHSTGEHKTDEHPTEHPSGN
jgi:hypothetical protein